MGGLSPPYLQLGGAEAPPAPPVPTPLTGHIKTVDRGRLSKETLFVNNTKKVSTDNFITVITISVRLQFTPYHKEIE